MKKRVCMLLIAILLVNFVSADGGMVIYDPDMAFWKPLDENSQFAFINHENNIEKMLLGVSVSKLEGEKAVWIFPVPAPPEKTSIDILRQTPRLIGIPLEESAKDKVTESAVLMSLTQVYTLPISIILSLFTPIAGSERFGEFQDVEVYQHVEKMGIITELVSAKNTDALTNYMKSKDLEFPDKLDSVLNEYITQDYCFVITWLSDVEEFKKHATTTWEYYRYSYSLGIYVEFPAEEIYFPLKPTSMYGKKEIPIIIYVMDYVTPKPYQNIEDKTTTEYFYEDRQYISENLTRFFGRSEAKDLRYTKIKITAPSDKLTEDLIISKEIPARIKVYEFIAKNILLCTIILFILLSCISSLISGLILFRKNSPCKLKFFLLGLFNFLTFAGFSIAACVLKIDEKFVNIKEKTKRASLKKSLKISFIYSLIIAAVIPIILSFSLIDDIFAVGFFEFIETAGFIAILLLLIFAPTFLILTPLIYAGYKNKKLLKFLISFSVLFNLLLLLTWILLTLTL